METRAIEPSLVAAEAAVAAGKSVAGTGFWGAVAAVKGTPELAERYADRISEVDRRAFNNWVLLRIPLHLGTSLMIFGTLAGLSLVGASYALDAPWAAVSFIVGFGILLVTTHGLAHLIVGTVVGIGFSAWFVGSLTRPQPGVKIDYASYLRSTPNRRAWMHASGAIMTKLLPFALVGAAVNAGLPMWIVWGLIGVGVVTAITDYVWSTTNSDWKRFLRERKLAQTS